MRFSPIAVYPITRSSRPAPAPGVRGCRKTRRQVPAGRPSFDFAPHENRSARKRREIARGVRRSMCPSTCVLLAPVHARARAHASASASFKPSVLAPASLPLARSLSIVISRRSLIASRARATRFRVVSKRDNVEIVESSLSRSAARFARGRDSYIGNYKYKLNSLSLS